MGGEGSDDRDTPEPRPGVVVPGVATSDNPAGADAPVSRGEYERRHRYLLWAVVAAFMFTIIGNGAGWTLYTHVQDQRVHDASGRLHLRPPTAEVEEDGSARRDLR